MEIVCRNIPNQISDKHLTREFRPVLAQFSIFNYECRKVNKRLAFLTVPDEQKGKRLLDRYGQDQGKSRKPAQQLRMFGIPIYLAISNNPPSEFLLLSLREDEQNHRHTRSITGPRSNAGDIQRVKSFLITAMSCGVWDYQQNYPVFVEFFRLAHSGSIVFGNTALRATVTNIPAGIKYFVEIPYWIVFDSIYTGTTKRPSVTITTDMAPRLYTSSSTDQLKAQIELLNKRARPPSAKKRVGYLAPGHERAAATCFTYRFVLQHSSDIQLVRNLGAARHIPDMIRWNDYCVSSRAPYQTLENEFDSYLERQPGPYAIKFQIQKLVWNGEATPGKITLFYPYVYRLYKQEGADAVILGLNRLSRELQYPSPNVNPSDVGPEALMEILKTSVDNLNRNQGDSGSTVLHPSNVMVHKATVTPCGIYLYGPCIETKNRVLRRYPDHIDHFLRVEFLDESGDPVFFNPQVSLEYIFHHRFASVLKQGIRIAGRLFQFLGFSHSSLRSQTSWFAAAFQAPTGEFLDAAHIIRELGKFDHIRSPAKQAARIGQAFSDTLTSISISPSNVWLNAPDVKRNGRVFSDGVGVLSRDVMYKIWNEYALREKVKPTVFQVRVAGAKGMVSYDSRRKGEYLMLRESMVKFPSENSWNIEICGSGIRALPFYLNNQLIKLLEDLGVPPAVFHKLQTDEVLFLKSTLKSTEQAAIFLEQCHISKAARLPWLIQILRELGVHYTQDPFIRRVVELAALLKLRDLKYRARIKVPSAVTLYGIMDETGFLQEGEIFCVFLTDQGYREILVRNNVVVTRAPALHPGDVQIVNAVDVPADSPLRRLHNCVAFSQYGKRDLPSMLSGGDLDGDLYNIIYDDRLLPERTYDAADYPLVKAKDIGRTVTKDDIVDFFVTFMEQDQLGRIANTHQVVADQQKEGTLHKDCILLASLHSAAVDFSKSGVPVDLTRIPKRSPCRPDFMAPSPRIQIAESIDVLTETNEMTIDDDDDEDERPRIRYYKSSKVLGSLFRAIDEQQFLKDLRDASNIEPKLGSAGALQKVWNYVQQETAGFQWDHLIHIQKDIQEIYEDKLRDLMRTYSATPWKSTITEFEVFVGTILGHGHKQSRRDKEASKTMRGEYDDLVNFIVSMIRDTGAGREESLERSVACFYACIKEHNVSQTPVYRNPNKEKLLSFPWIAAMACLREVDMFQRSLPF